MSKTADRAVSSRFVHWAILLGAAAIAILPLLIHGPSCGHDYSFHVTSWFDALKSWRHGIFYPHWAASANLGVGEPRFVFYPPLSWMLGAALGAILPWHLVPAALTFLMLVVCGFATRALGRSFLSDVPATLAGCLAIFSGYPAYCAYARTAFGELLGGFWIPIILLLVLRSRRQEGNAWRRALDGSTVLLSLAIAGAWLSNGPVGVMACSLLAAVATLGAVLERSWAKVIRATVALVVGMALAGFYLVPVAHERAWVELYKATDEPWNRIENNFIFADSSFAFNPVPEMAEHDRVNHQVSLIGMTMITLSMGAIVVAWLRKRLAKRQQWMPLAAIPVMVLLLQLPISQPIWDLLPLWRMLQFPWRWLLILEAPIAIFLMLALWPETAGRKERERKRATKNGHGNWQRAAVVILCGAVVLTEVAVAFMVFPACTEKNSFAGLLLSLEKGPGVAGQLEYAPDGVDSKLVTWGLPGACLVRQPLARLGVAMTTLDRSIILPVWKAEQGSCEATYALEEASVRREDYRVQAVLEHPGYLILRLRRYPAWRVSVNGRTVEGMPEREDGLIAVPVPAGAVHVDVDWVTTPDVMTGRWLSVVGLLMLAGLWVVERRWVAEAGPVV